MGAILIAAGCVFLVVLYYLYLWGSRDVRFERAMSKMKSQVERMQRGVSAGTTGSMPLVAPQVPGRRSRTPDPASPLGIRLAAPAPLTRREPGNGVVTTDTARAAIDGAPAGAGVAPRLERRQPPGVPRQARPFPETAKLRARAQPGLTPRLFDGTVT